MERCRKFNECPKLDAVFDQDVPWWLTLESIDATCGECDEYEEAKDETLGSEDLSEVQVNPDIRDG